MCCFTFRSKESSSIKIGPSTPVSKYWAKKHRQNPYFPSLLPFPETAIGTVLWSLPASWNQTAAGSDSWNTTKVSGSTGLQNPNVVWPKPKRSYRLLHYALWARHVSCHQLKNCTKPAYTLTDLFFSNHFAAVGTSYMPKDKRLSCLEKWRFLVIAYRLGLCLIPR